MRSTRASNPVGSATNGSSWSFLMRNEVYGNRKPQTQTDRTLPEFELGTTYLTRGVDQTVPGAEVFLVLQRHRRGDWGNLCDQDRKSNEDALKTGARLFFGRQAER